MATAQITMKGHTSVLSASISVYEKTRTGTTRTVNVQITVNVVDDPGKYNRSFSASVDFNGTPYPTSGTISTSKVIFDRDVTVDLPYGSSTANNFTLTYSATLSSPTYGDKTITGNVPAIEGLTVDRGKTSLSLSDSMDFGSPCECTWTPTSKTAYYKLTFDIGSRNKTTDPIHPNTTDSFTYRGFTIPLEWADQIPNTTHGRLNVSLYSYSDSACTQQIGAAVSGQIEINLADNESTRPTISAYEAIVDNSRSSKVASWGIALTGYSAVNLRATAKGAYGSTIIRFQITGGYKVFVNDIQLNYVGRVISSEGSQTFTISCTDSRGRQSSAVTTSPINFIKYTPPTVLNVTSQKNDNGFAEVISTFSYDSIDGRNSLTKAILQSRVAGTETWIDVCNIQSDTKVVTNISPTDTQSYYFRVHIEDSVGNSSERESYLSTMKVLLDFKADGDGLGIGKICEKSGLEVSMNSTFSGGLNIWENDVGLKTLKEYIQSTMLFLADNMYGIGEPPAAQKVGQIYYKKVVDA